MKKESLPNFRRAEAASGYCKGSCKQPESSSSGRASGRAGLQLRRAMQIELKRLQKKLGITFIYITHDQEEAINMSDRIAVMNQGKFEQIGTPDEIYNHPKTSYVATFVETQIF